METKPNVVIGMPVNGKMEQMTTGCIANAIIGANGVVSNFLMRVSADIVSSRTWLVKEALKSGATHLLFIDSDMFFPSDVIPRMLARGKDILGVEYNRRRMPIEGTSQPLTEKNDDIYQAKHAGTGLMLIDLKVFKDWDGAWFNFGRDSEGMLKLGEDAWFCYSARDRGIETYIDATIKTGHIGNYIY